MKRRYSFLAACSTVLVLACSSQVESVGSESDDIRQCNRNESDANISLPKDEGPHAAQPSEWWYYTGHLLNERNERFGFELVFFQFGTATVATLAVTDVNGQAFYHETAGSSNSYTMTHDRFDVSIGAWKAKGTAGNDSINASMKDGTAIDLDLTSLKAPAFDYDKGEATFPAGNAFAYSRTRMLAGGTLTLKGEKMTVVGEAWFDHQWGAFSTALGWDWSALQLDNGEELMLVRLRDANQNVLGVDGVFVSRTCKKNERLLNAISFTPTGTWHSPNTKKTYPAGWSVEVPSQKLVLKLSPLVADQEVYNSQLSPQYWEGAVDVNGTENGAKVHGNGYVELVGY